MSRSHKKAIDKGYGGWKRWAKRQASKAVRRFKGPIPDGSAYKKVYDSWEITDWAWDACHTGEPPARDKTAFLGDDGYWYVDK